MTLVRVVAAACLVLLLAQCGTTESAPGPDKVTITVADHADALTSNPGDNLFILTLSESTKSYALTDVTMSAGLPGQTETQVNYTHNDTNANGQLDKGETLVGKEPVVNLFDSSTVGKGVNVHFTVPFNGIKSQVGSAVWTPAN